MMCRRTSRRAAREGPRASSLISAASRPAQHRSASRAPAWRSRSTAWQQGYITDVIADLLRNEGFESAVVDLGEFRTLGRHPDGRPWRLASATARRRAMPPHHRARRHGARRCRAAMARRSSQAGASITFSIHTPARARMLLSTVAVIGPRATAAKRALDRDLRCGRARGADVACGLSGNAGDSDAAGWQAR